MASFAPQASVRMSSTELSLFGSNKKTPKNTKKQKKTTENSDKKSAAWKKFARIAVTGSPDGISLLGKPQHDWVTGKALSKPKSHSWTTSYKQTESRRKK